MADVQLSWFNPTTGSREARALIADATPAGLWRRGALVLVAAQVGGSGGEWHVWRSADDGRAVAQITTDSIWDAAAYRNAHVNAGLLGGAMSVATVRDSDPLEVVWKATGNPAAWPADGVATAVGTYGGTRRLFSTFCQQDRFAQFVGNGVDAMWRSVNGQTFDPFLLTNIWNPANFKNSHVISVPGGAMAALAQRVDSDPLEYWFKWSGDGRTWQSDGAATLAATYSGDKRIFHLMEGGERWRLLLSNGHDAAGQSEDNGVASPWTAI